MHIIHTTDAIILSLETTGEQDVRAVCLTRDFGLVKILAVSGRVSENKHRAHLVRFARVIINMVSGKNGYRLTGIHERAPFRDVLGHIAFPIYVKLARLITKLTGENEPQTALYEFFDQLFDTHGNMNERYLKGFEIFAVMKILTFLGYWKDESTLMPTLETFDSLASSYDSYVRAINRAIEHTHLVS